MLDPYFKSLIGALLLSASGLAESAITLELTPLSRTASSVGVGITVFGLGAGEAPSLGSYDLDLHFDSSHLEYVGTRFGDPTLGNELDVHDFGLNVQAADLSSTGVLNLFELSFDSPADLNALQADSFTLAVVTFTFLQAGSSPLNLAVNALADADGDGLTAGVSSATVAPVPLPSAFWLMATGLTALFGRDRRSAGGVGDRSVTHL
ncbi:uncharacterized protein sS8_4504 [Methylocaldum marinum]|uniref:Cohesin domain-containing protein n=1 Tax=Methylocaldum marinum TaxID=1432792 RepID=A0A250KY57_9GAMM|nr:hypothetical protein [Methylocaldum marinum]BBA36434.1 uncharacterized protein sS8_4504 [Methylocaldum marinum]